MIKSDKLSKEVRKFNLKDTVQEKIKDFMSRFTIDAENRRRKEYNARVDAGQAEKKVKYLHTYKGTKFDR